MERGLRTAIAIAEPVEQPVVVTAATNEVTAFLLPSLFSDYHSDLSSEVSIWNDGHTVILSRCLHAEMFYLSI